MAAVFTGNGLGTFQSSLSQLGVGLGGNAGLGQSRSNHYVNASNGNLVLSSFDESLFGHGFATGLVRTYNSQGSFAQAGADAWVTGYERSVRLASGTANMAGSTVERDTADGSVVTYVWDAGKSAYVATAGEGAHDTITLSGSGSTAKWLWTEGSTQIQETYTASSLGTAGRLEKIVDLATDATYTLTYTGMLLTTITGTNGETLEFGYDVSNRLISLGTRERDAAGTLVLKGQVGYGYDAAGRLSWIQTDLTPENAADNAWDASVAANNDGKSYRVTYTYADSASLRITGVATSDGITVAYTYDGNGRVASVAQGGAADGSTQILTYTYAAGATTVTDAANRSWTYQYDAAGQLTAVLEPAIGGQRAVTEYIYDAAGNVERIRQAAYAGAASTLETVYQYDANGNVVLQRDRQGNTVTRTYNSANRLLTEARYTVPDADGLDPTHAGTANLPGGAQITRYVYDTANPRLLRFVVNAAGEVTETQYLASGVAQGLASLQRSYVANIYDTSALAATAVPTLADMTAWIAGKLEQTARTDFAYDTQGRLAQRTSYATVSSTGSAVLDSATSIVRYTYDAQGLLRQQLTVHGAARTLTGAAPSGGEVVDFVYDGLGRLLSSIRRSSDASANDDANTIVATTAYADSARQIVTTLDSGMVRTEARNAAGLVISVTESGTVAGSLVTKVATNIFDATGRLRAIQDAAGARTYFFYDLAGRLVATVDATGAVTRTQYDAAGRASGATSYAIRVNTSTWTSAGVVTKDALVFAATSPTLGGNEAWVQIDAANDRLASRTYDAAGRLETEVDAAGLTTTYVYDGAGHLLSSTVGKPGDATVVPRVTRFFYDAADRLVATLDADGRLVESIYDTAGRVVQIKRYAAATDPAYRAAGTLAQLRPAPDAVNDQFERYLYDGRGNLIGKVDAEGYLTEYVYDEAANQRAVKEYAKKLAGLTGSETLATLRTQATTTAPAEAYRLIQRSFNGRGQLVTELNAEGMVTRYSYDEAGRLVRTEAAQGTSDVRENYDRYDVFGQLIGQMSGVQAAAAAASLGKSLNDPTLTEAQLDSVYAQYGVRHGYDALGRRIESIDAGGAKTFYFYDAVGRQTFTVRGVKDANGIANAQGEVTELRYTTFGQVSDELAYTGRIAITTPGSRASAQAAISTLSFATATDTRRQYAYDQRGLLTRLTDAEGSQTVRSYTAFGQLYEETTAYGTSLAATTRYAYNARGAMNQRIEAVGTALARTTTLAYDAFGHVSSSTDSQGLVTTFAYDRMGRQVGISRTVAGQAESVSTAYDAFDRIVSQTDARGYVTTYAHSDSARSVVVTSPEGVAITTAHNLFGQTVTVSRALPGGGTATTITAYDKNGAVVSVTDPLGNAAGNVYDVRGLLAEATDASGRKVQYAYDAVGRVLTRVEDPGAGKLNLTTSYAYDGQGRQLKVTDASGRVTQMSYDREGRLTQVAKDPAGLNLRTVTAYDAAGRVLSVTDGYGTAAATMVQYAYDALNRRVSETIDPGAGKLNLTTSYAYDAHDNVVTRTDALGKATRYAYDEANRLRFMVDATGALTETVYDKNGNAILTRGYAKALSAVAFASLATAPSVATLQGLVTSESLKNDTTDQLAYRVLDKDNRVRFTLDAVGTLTETRYDGAGRAQQTLVYGTAFTTAAVLTKLRAGTAVLADFASFVTANEAVARASQFVYDASGRVAYTLARNGAQAVVTERRYDASGLVVADVTYARTIAYTVGQTAAQVAGAITAAGGDAAAQQRLTRYAYDGAGRLRFTVDDAGGVTEQRYDAAGRIASTHAYATAVSVTMMTETAIAALVAGQANVHWTSHAYDNAGRLANTTDALNKTESYGYDAVGRRTSFTNKLGATWTYEYDAAGRMTVERSPSVNVARYDASGNIVVGAASIVTRRAYDALGQVVAVTENADTAEARTVTYQYDARGRQIKTIFPDAWQLDAYNRLAATGVLPEINVSYDALDRAVVQRDVRNNYSYKVYDSQGRLAYDIDEAGYVTAYAYNAFDEQTALTRYANKLDFGKLTGWTAGQAITLAQMGIAGALVADGAGDRVLTTTYDQLGRKTAVTQPAITYYKANGTSASGSPTTQFVYDAYGNVVKERVLLEGTPGQADAVWADTFRYYDDLGRLIRSVDAEGYVTGLQYDALGQVLVQVEFARKLDTASINEAVLPALPATGDSSIGYDRTTTCQYDVLGRKTAETSQRLYQSATGTNGMRNVTTNFGYDAEGRLTSTVVDGVATSALAYDALGRTLSTTETQRKVLRSDWQTAIANDPSLNLSSAALYVDAAPYTTMEYDAFGNALRVVRYAEGDPASGAPNAGNASNATTMMRYDRQGRVVGTWDAAGTAWWSRYDAADHVVDTWYNLSSNSDNASVHTVASYDETGRQLTTVTTRSPSIGPAVIDTRSAVQYNAFGEITAKAETLALLADATQSARYAYDRAGRLATSNADTGTTRSYFYNLAGHQLREERLWTDGTTASTAVFIIKNDKLGRAVGQVLPSWKSDAAATAQINVALDRWGNVLRQTDARGNVTEFSYNDRNQVIRQLAPRVKVVDEAGNESWLIPETKWMYDALGRLIATRDANGHAQGYTYDAAGQLTSSTDATLAVSRQAYDARGRNVAAQNAVGYITYVDYDGLDRATAQGDFLLNNAGTARTKTALQTFVLNQNGDRLQVTDATGLWNRYDYDSRGLLLRSQTQTGVVHTYAYDAQGRKTGDTDSLNNSNTWVYDYFGRLTDHIDLGGANYDYAYDARSGLLTVASSSRTTTVMAPGGRDPYDPMDPDYEFPEEIVLTEQLFNRKTEYYANGQVRRVTDGAIYYYYEYDASGNRTLEETKTVDGRGMLVHTITRTAYDSNNRISRVTTQDMAAGGVYTLDLTYDYDAVGNRRRVIANSAYGTNASPLTVGNRAPVVVGQPGNQTINAGLATQWTLDTSAYFADPDGTPFSYMLTLANGNPAPSWLHMTFDAATGLLRFSADAGSAAAFGQSFTLRLTATDAPALGTPLSVSSDFTLSVVNNAPVVATPIPDQTATATGSSWSYTVPATTFSDYEGGALTYTASGMPTWMTFNAATRTFSGTPSAIGSWNVTVTARDPGGATVSDTFAVTTPNAAPIVASPIADQLVAANQGWGYVLPATAFVDRNGQTLTYAASGLPAWMTFNAATRTFSGTAPASGSWSITVTASDGSLSATDTFTIGIGTPTNQMPVVPTPIPDQTANATGGSWSYTIPTGTFSDPEGGVLSYTASGMPGWMSFNAATRTFSGTPSTVGSWNVTVTAQDPFGLVVSDTFAVTTPNAAPIVSSPIPDQSATASLAWTYVVPAATFADRNGQALTYSATGMPAWMTFNAATRTFSGTAPASGSWAITVAAGDGALSASDTFTLSINQAPVLVTPIPDQTANATGGSWSYTIPAASFSDPEGGALTYTVSGMPAWMAFNATTRTFSGTPSTVGSWVITVTAKDASGTGVSDAFTVTTPNVAPLLSVPIPDQTMNLGQAWTYTFPATAFVDRNGQALTYTVSGIPAWMTFNAATRTFSGTSSTASVWNITVTASDGSLSASDTFKLNVGNLAPTVANPIATQSAVVNTAWSYTVPANTFQDGNGDTLTYSAYQWMRYTEYDPEFGHTFYWDTGPLPSWLSFNATTRTFTGTPPSLADIQLQVWADDGRGGIATDTFTLSINAAPNQAPTVPAPIPDQTAYATGGGWSYAFPAGTFADPEGGALTYTASGMPAWMTFNASTRTFSGTPSTVGSWNVTVTAQDPSGATVSDTFAVTTPNAAPYVVTPIPDKTAATGQAFNYVFPAFGDLNGQPLTYTLAGAPAWMTFNAATRTLSGTPTGGGTYTLTVTASDGSLSVNDSFTLTVSSTPPPNAAPFVNRPLVDQDEFIDYTFAADTFVDPDGDTLTYTYSVSPLAPNITFNAATRTFSGYANGGKYGKNYVITVTANDGQGHTVSDSFNYYVSGYMDPLVAGGSGGLYDTLAASEMQVENDQQAMMLPPDEPTDPGDPGDGTPPPTTPNTQTLWFTYDAANRVQVVNGTLVNGQILVAPKQTGSTVESYALHYDAAGNAVNRTTVTATGVTETSQSTYNQRGQLDLEYNTVAPGETTGVVAKHTYDAAGREIDETRYFAPGTIKTYRTGNPNDPDTEWIDVDVGGWRSQQTKTTYDADGRISVVNELGRYGGAWFASGDGALTALSNTYYSNASGVSGYDAAGRLQTYRYQKLTGIQYTHTYTTGYEARDTYLEKSVSGTSTDTNYKPTTTSSTYDPTGRRVAITQTTPISGQPSLTYLRYFSYDANGGILTRRDGKLENGAFVETANSRKHFVYANGQQVVTLGEDGKIDAASQLTAFDSSETGTEAALVLEGDTLQSIAQRVYGNSSLWYVLAAANAVTDADLVPGTTLKVPEVKTTANDASTFKPYDPNAIEGPTTPSLPYITPPPKKQCDTFAMVMIIVIAIVVTVATWGAASGAMASAAQAGLAQGAAIGATASTGLATATVTATGITTSLSAGGAMLAGAAAGAAGAAASGVVGSGMGVSSFSWRNVAAGAITGALTAGIANKFGTVTDALSGANPNYLKAAGLAAANAGANYAGQALAGVNTSFSWLSIATSAVSSVVAAKVAPWAVNKLDVRTDFAKDFTAGIAGGMVSAAVRSSFGQTLHESDYLTIAADAFGNALGNASARRIQNWQARSQRISQAELLGPGTSFSRVLNDPAYMPQWLEEGYSEYLAQQAGVTIRQRQEDIRNNPELGQPLTDAERRKLIQEQAAEAESRGGVWAGSAEENNILAWTSHAMQKGIGALYRHSVPMPTLATDSNTWRSEMHRPIHDAILQMYPEHTDSILRDATDSELFGRRVDQFLNGVGNAVAGVVVDPILMVADGLRAGYSVAMTEATGSLYEINMWSSLGKSAEAGATTGELLQHLNPVYQVLISQHDLREAHRRKDYDSFSYQLGNITGNVAMAAALGKFGGTRIAPGSLAGATRWTVSSGMSAAKWTWSSGKSVVGSMFEGPAFGSPRAQWGAIGNLSKGSPLTATQLRNTSGIVTASGELSPVSGRWLDASTPTPIPAQVADALVGREFATFGDLQSAVWRAIGNNDDLASGFTSRNIAQMRAGLAPFAPQEYLNASGAFGQSFNLHHQVWISRGGPVYDLSNLYIVSPRAHYGIHY